MSTDDIASSGSLGRFVHHGIVVTSIAALWLSQVTSVSGQAAGAISDTVRVPVKGAALFLEIRGRADQAPVLLYLHGGPGNAFGLVSFRAYAGPLLERQALVGYLHQRGVIHSPTGGDSLLTVSTHIHDVRAVIDYLRRRFPNRPVYLLGHSWGGLLAVLTVIDHPAGIAGVINASGSFDVVPSMVAAFRETAQWARDSARPDAQAELAQVGEPPYSTLEQQMVLSKWATTARGGIGSRIDPAILLGRPPFLTFDQSWQAAQLAITTVMFGELNRTTTSSRVGSIKTPLLMVVGSRDLVIPASAVRAGYDRWGGPKRWVELSDSHHLPFVDEPSRFTQAIVEFIR